MKSVITNRHDFVFLFDVTNGNPNGDPDAGNAPRTDAETGHGLVSDVCLKRKIRDFVTLAKAKDDGTPQAGYDIYIKHRGVLQSMHEQAYEVNGLDPEEGDPKKKVSNVEKARAWMCQTFFDIRAFGAVLTLDLNCGQVRGPVQIAFARSIDPISTPEQSIVRKAVAKTEEADKQIAKHGQVTGTMGSKSIVPYGLYRVHGFVNAALAPATGFSEDDLSLIWDALGRMFEFDHSATRGEMASRRLLVFKHDSKLGSAPSHKLFDLVKVTAKDKDTPPRSFADYEVTIDRAGLPTGVELLDLI